MHCEIKISNNKKVYFDENQKQFYDEKKMYYVTTKTWATACKDYYCIL